MYDDLVDLLSLTNFASGSGRAENQRALVSDVDEGPELLPIEPEHDEVRDLVAVAEIAVRGRNYAQRSAGLLSAARAALAKKKKSVLG